MTAQDNFKENELNKSTETDKEMYAVESQTVDYDNVVITHDELSRIHFDLSSSDIEDTFSYLNL